MFLKQKQSGKLKAHGFEYGQPQREYVSKDESSSPTISIYALITKCVISAMEEKKGSYMWYSRRISAIWLASW